MPTPPIDLTKPDRDLDKLQPAVRADVDRFVGAFNRNQPKTPIHVFEAFRTFERQAYLFAQGRTAPSSVPCSHGVFHKGKTIFVPRPVGTCPLHPLGAVVTNAKPGGSWHNYGMAVDVVFDADPVKPGIQWTWDGKLPWANVGSMAMGMGFEWAGSWRTFKEYPHLEKTFGLKIHEAAELHRQGGLPAVWAAL